VVEEEEEEEEEEEDEDEDDDDEDDDDDDAGFEAGDGYQTISNAERQQAEELMQGDPDEVIQTKVMGTPPAPIKLVRSDLRCLQNGEWLNDEVINMWLDFVKDRSVKANAEEPGSMPTVYIMKSFFYSRLCFLERPGGDKQDVFDFPGVRRWTRKVDVFSHDFIFIPLHQGMHWALAVVNMREKRLQYFDSMSGAPNKWWVGSHSVLIRVCWSLAA